MRSHQANMVMVYFFISQTKFALVACTVYESGKYDAAKPSQLNFFFNFDLVRLKSLKEKFCGT